MLRLENDWKARLVESYDGYQRTLHGVTLNNRIKQLDKLIASGHAVVMRRKTLDQRYKIEMNRIKDLMEGGE